MSGRTRQQDRVVSAWCIIILSAPSIGASQFSFFRFVKLNQVHRVLLSIIRFVILYVIVCITLFIGGRYD